MYKCADCHGNFEDTDFVRVRHGLLLPPFELKAVCPICQSEEIYQFNPYIPKSEVAEKLLEAVKNFHLYRRQIEEMFGREANNQLYDDAVWTVESLILDMYSNVKGIDKALLSVTDDKGIKEIIKELGE